jgi:hypothetical protein
LQKTVDGIFLFRGWLIRHFFPPRIREIDMGIRQGSNGRFQRKSYDFEPWYVKETAWSRMLRNWGIGNEKKLPGPEFMSDGFLPEELGPVEFIEKSRAPVLAQAEEMRAYAERGGAVGVGCPFMLARQ